MMDATKQNLMSNKRDSESKKKKKSKNKKKQEKLRRENK